MESTMISTDITKAKELLLRAYRHDLSPEEVVELRRLLVERVKPFLGPNDGALAALIDRFERNDPNLVTER
jgi:hypothetical protein